MQPKYCENVIVGVVYKKEFNWYITRKELWRLDYIKEYQSWKDCYRKMGRSEKQFNYDIGSLDEFCNNRWGIQIIDEKNVDIFLTRVEKYKVSFQKLKEMFYSSKDKNGFYPSFYVDFDRKEFYSYFPEPETFEEYVPNGWFGAYQPLDKLIPKEYKYWH